MMSSSANIEMSHGQYSSGAGANSSFDGLKREATRLERHIEERVGIYQELSQRLSDPSTTNPRRPVGGASSHLDAAETGQSSSLLSNDVNAILKEEQSLSAEIERLISTMSELNKKMASIAESSGRSQQTLLVRRYREILYDYSTDFKKIRANIARKRDEAELFKRRNGTLAGGNDNSKGSDMDHLLREKNAISNSLLSATSVIGQAREIHGDLRTQRTMLHGVSGTMANLTANVPGINRLIESIRKKKNKDNMVVSGVIATCILFSLWYLFS